MNVTAPHATRRRLEPSLAVKAKALRLLAHDRVTVLEVGPDRTVVQVVGDHATYELVGTASGWSCPCPVLRGPCSHVTAARLVAPKRRPR